MPKKKKNKSQKTTRVGERYMELVREFPLIPFSSNEQFAEASSIFSKLTLEISNLKDDENLYREALGVIIAAYERQKRVAIAGSPVQIIKDLMIIHGLRQIDLVAQFGSRSLVSEFLAGKRELSKEQIIRLCKRFSLNPLALMPEAAQAS